MVKSISTIYINSEVLKQAKEKGLNISEIAEETIRIALKMNIGGGGVEVAFGNFLNSKMERNKDIVILRRAWNNSSKSRGHQEIFTKVIRGFCEKHHETIANTLVIAEGKREVAQEKSDAP